eukprot:TRINITY_DN18693_c0_g2_i1.p1 TRINITY_DN18693_c0_g2~~TRINITY_DN18693_c0_g2_i1.p1  ORF type:complete len:695 (-),score=202.74 TRINITY_DN18693_c0_g2_i1:42-2126(-)
MLVDRFQTERRVRMILLSITAAGVGITLTAGSIAAFAELYWTPGVMAQAEDRIHRIGQKSQCLIQFLVSDTPTMDQHLLSSISLKQKTLQSTTGISKDASGFANANPLRAGQQTVAEAFSNQRTPSNTRPVSSGTAVPAAAAMAAAAAPAAAQQMGTCGAAVTTPVAQSAPLAGVHRSSCNSTGGQVSSSGISGNSNANGTMGSGGAVGTGRVSSGGSMRAQVLSPHQSPAGSHSAMHSGSKPALQPSTAALPFSGGSGQATSQCAGDSVRAIGSGNMQQAPRLLQQQHHHAPPVYNAAAERAPNSAQPKVATPYTAGARCGVQRVANPYVTQPREGTAAEPQRVLPAAAAAEAAAKETAGTATAVATPQQHALHSATPDLGPQQQQQQFCASSSGRSVAGATQASVSQLLKTPKVPSPYQKAHHSSAQAQAPRQTMLPGRSSSTPTEHAGAPITATPYSTSHVNAAMQQHHSGAMPYMAASQHLPHAIEIAAGPAAAQRAATVPQVPAEGAAVVGVQAQHAAASGGSSLGSAVGCSAGALGFKGVMQEGRVVAAPHGSTASGAQSHGKPLQQPPQQGLTLQASTSGDSRQPLPPGASAVGERAAVGAAQQPPPPPAAVSTAAAAPPALTAEQLARMERHRQEALAKLAQRKARLSSASNASTAAATPSPATTPAARLQPASTRPQHVPYPRSS